MIAILLSALLTTTQAMADGVEVRVEAINAVTKIPLSNFDVQLHPLKRFDIQSTQLRTNRLGVATMTAPRPAQYILLVAPTNPFESTGIQCATVTVRPNQPLTVKFELGEEIPKERRCDWLEAPATTPMPTETDPQKIFSVTF